MRVLTQRSFNQPPDHLHYFQTIELNYLSSSSPFIRIVKKDFSPETRKSLQNAHETLLLQLFVD